MILLFFSSLFSSFFDCGALYTRDCSCNTLYMYVCNIHIHVHVHVLLVLHACALQSTITFQLLPEPRPGLGERSVPILVGHGNNSTMFDQHLDTERQCSDLHCTCTSTVYVVMQVQCTTERMHTAHYECTVYETTTLALD